MCFLNISCLFEIFTEAFIYALVLLDRDANVEVKQTSIYVISLIRFHFKLRRRTRVFFGEISQRNQARGAFQEIVNQEFGKRIHADMSDSLFEMIGILSTDHYLSKTSIVTMLESLYDSKLSSQASERAPMVPVRERL